MLNFDSDWRWLIDREDSPWYPTMRLFRQSKYVGKQIVPTKPVKYVLAQLNIYKQLLI
ncbi:hypothetical protein [Okeania sp. KiyG1]|uniref:hypothetical protein n=1 Tax=Okeania sp. KiyG1 TaxID=2720165 RepID=UPI0019CC6EEC|nr:hypothetical protein [Okeania sp. KiyG1]GGA05112.1 hypothetical protein CYANOKiyG1_17440 [Okeania sp. KiyG1]